MNGLHLSESYLALSDTAHAAAAYSNLFKRYANDRQHIYTNVFFLALFPSTTSAYTNIPDF